MSEPTTVGIHLCGSVLRRAELRRSGPQTVVVTAELPLAEDEPAGVPLDSVSAASAEVNAAVCVAAMPAGEVLSRCWSFPDADEGTFRQMVAHRLQADLPVPIEELTWGYRRGAARASPDPQRQVFAQAARTKLVEQRLATLSAVGLPVDVLTTEAEAIGALYRHGLARREADGTEVLVLADDDDWLVAVLGEGLLQSLRHVPVAPDRIELACRECQQAIEALVSRRDLRRVLWCAPEEQAQARDALARQLGLAVEPVEPAEHLVNADGTRLTPAHLARFGPAIGLALAGAFEADRLIRLGGGPQSETAPHGRRVQFILAHPWRWTAAAAGLLVLATALHVGAIAMETREMRTLMEEIGPGGSPMAALQPKVRAMQRLETYRIDVEGIIADLCGPIPDSITLSSIQLARDKRLVIKGKSRNPKAIFALADALRKSQRFAAVNPEGTEPAQGGGFTISAEIVDLSPLPAFAGRGGPWR